MKSKLPKKRGTILNLQSNTGVIVCAWRDLSTVMTMASNFYDHEPCREFLRTPPENKGQFKGTKYEDKEEVQMNGIIKTYSQLQRVVRVR